MVLDIKDQVRKSHFKHINGSPPPLSRQVLGVHPPSALLLKFIEARKEITNHK